MPRQLDTGEPGGKVVWDTGSSLYDSYELAAVRRLLDGRLLAGVRPLPDEPPPAPAENQRDESKQQVMVVAEARRAGRKKLTLRKLFRTLASWAISPRQANACTCVGISLSGGITAHGGAVQPVVSSNGKV